MRSSVIASILLLVGCQNAEAPAKRQSVDPLTRANMNIVQLLRTGSTAVCGNDTAKRAAVSALIQNASFTALTQYLNMVSAGKRIELKGAFATDLRKELGEVSCRAKIGLNAQEYDFDYSLRPSANDPNDYIVDASIAGLSRSEFGQAVSAEVARQMPNLK